MVAMGFGYRLGIDLPGEARGFIPNAAFYDKWYSKRWNGLTIASISIGQGEVTLTPLQIANLGATIANRGFYYTPHIIKDSENVTIDRKYKEKNYTMVDTTHFHKVIGGMYRAVNSGYGSGGTASVAAVEGLDICGKTGTAQNPHGNDHSVFICFAPRDNPKIAVAAYVENGGFGATWAAPIASLLTEKYLNGEISEGRKALEERMLNGDLMDRVKVKK
jgi:penicillin-binding protein 2